MANSQLYFYSSDLYIKATDKVWCESFCAPVLARVDTLWGGKIKCIVDVLCFFFLFPHSVETAEIWCSDIETIHERYNQRWHIIKMHILWPYLFVQKKDHDRYLQWAIAAKFIDPE